MKKLFFVIAILVISSCKKEASVPTTYQIFNSTTPFATKVQYLDGSLYQVLVYHYSGAKIIQQDSFVKITSNGGNTEKINVPDKTEILKVSFKMFPPESPFYNLPENKRLYLAGYVTIRREENNIIGVNGSSQITDTLVKSNTLINFLK